MKANEFIDKIQKLKPDFDDFKNVEISEELIREWIKEFDVSRISLKKYDTEILTLISAYDLSNLRINDITFDSDYQEDNKYIYFGWDINDRLVLDKNSGRIFAYDGFGDRIAYKCAENEEKFLDALYEIAKFSKEKMINLYTEEIRDEKSIVVAYTAALKAGGEEYEDYYKSVLWVE
jgi:hypothetical protein